MDVLLSSSKLNSSVSEGQTKKGRSSCHTSHRLTVKRPVVKIHVCLGTGLQKAPWGDLLLCVGNICSQSSFLFYYAASQVQERCSNSRRSFNEVWWIISFILTREGKNNSLSSLSSHTSMVRHHNDKTIIFHPHFSETRPFVIGSAVSKEGVQLLFQYINLNRALSKQQLNQI